MGTYNIEDNARDEWITAQVIVIKVRRDGDVPSSLLLHGYLFYFILFIFCCIVGDIITSPIYHSDGSYTDHLKSHLRSSPHHGQLPTAHFQQQVTKYTIT